MKYRTVELFIWLYLEETHINTTSLIYQRNTYNITYNTKLHWICIYIHYITDIYLYVREAHTDTGTYILYHIHIEEVHTDITTLTEAT